MGVSYRKIKSVAKDIVVKSEFLDKKISETMQVISSLVGATLGPGGCPVLIERQEYGMPNMLTKDGVTAVKSLGFKDPIQHAILETVRDCSMRTSSEAGDGTTTSIVLAEAIDTFTRAFLKKNKNVSPQRVVKTIEKLQKQVIEPKIKSLAISPDDNVLRAVAKCSANGEDELADAVMECFNLVGDNGNVTLLEEAGPSGYKVGKIDGYPLTVGLEQCCGRFAPAFINDRASNRALLNKVLFVLYYGKIESIVTLVPILKTIGEKWNLDPKSPSNVVVAATSFSENVVAYLSQMWTNEEALNVFPLMVPRLPTINGEFDLLQDLSAITGSPVYDPAQHPIENGTVDELGPALPLFEANMYRSSITGVAEKIDPRYEGLILSREEEVSKQRESADLTDLQRRLIDERLGKLTGGIAQLTVVAPSSGEIREQKDRADDAICAVRGARVHGGLPGAGWTLLQLVKELNAYEGTKFEKEVIQEILINVCKVPIIRIMSNIGFNQEEINERLLKYGEIIESGEMLVWDGVTDDFVDPLEYGIIDSLPAVREAIRNSLSIATRIGTLGGIVVFPRDEKLEREEAMGNHNFLKETDMLGT